jgi:hypothetical protein
MAEGAIGVVIMAGMAVVMDGAIVVAMGMDTVAVVAMEMDMVDTNLDIRNPMATRNLSISHRQCTIPHSNYPASVCFFRLILVGRHRLKRAHVNAMD